MAATVSHAMRRYPSTPPDTKYSNFSPLRSDSPPGPGGSGSALSRSMRYAEPWLYGSVRGAPVLLMQPMVPVPLCNCAEYVCGTARSHKKTSTCKKCKGTRVPLSGPGGTVRAKYGTVRGYPTSSPAPPLTSVRAGTVRVTNSSSRPSILPPSPTIDPYDLMRRSRLSCPDVSVGSQFRARSQSPNKSMRNYSSSSSSSSRSKNRPRSPSPGNNILLGRKSILECDVNPYELMSTDGEKKESKLSNGRLKGTKHVIDSDYEDIEIGTVRKISQIPKLQNKKKQGTIRQKTNERETIRNEAKFKSILKKPSSTFGDTDTISSSDAHKSGSHFYLPMPTLSPPRKRVQFLVENESDRSAGNNDRKDITVILAEAELVVPARGREDLDSRESAESESSGAADEDIDNEPCRLKRSLSERLGQGAPSISFNDTMALRSPRTRSSVADCGGSTLFDAVTDLQRLDGIGSRPRPREPPPPPPPPSFSPPPPPVQERPATPPPRAATELAGVYEVTMVKENGTRKISFEKEANNSRKNSLEEKHDKQKKNKEDKKQENNKKNINEKQTRKVSFEKEADDIQIITNENNKKSSDKQNRKVSFEEEIQIFDEHTTKIVDNNPKQCNNKAIETSKMNENNKTQNSNKQTENSKMIDKIITPEEETPPSVPPRKRSNSKTPATIQVTTKKESVNQNESLTDKITEVNKKETNNEKCTFDISAKDDADASSKTNEIANIVLDEPTNTILNNESAKEEIEENYYEATVETKEPVLFVKESSSVVEKEPVIFDTPKITINSPDFASVNENISSTKIENPEINYSYQKVKIEPAKTIVQINSPKIQIIPSTVHRLQIKNEFQEHVNYNKVCISESPQRKTSIMINGDDCYSTVNVNDDVPIYQSSVVVNDYDSSKIEIGSGSRSSSVYITGDFQSNSTPLSSRTSKSEERPKKTLVILEGNSSAPSTPSPTIVNGQSTPEIVGKTFVVLQEETPTPPKETSTPLVNGIEKNNKEEDHYERPSSEELLRLLKDPVEAVKRNLVPHVCGKADVERKPKNKKPITSNSLVARLLEDPFLGSLAEGLETNTVAKLIEDSLLKLRSQDVQEDDKDALSENDSYPPYELMEAGSDSYSNHSNRSSVTEDELGTRSKFYQLLADAALSEIEDHHYECIKPNVDPIYEEIEIPPPLPSNPPPSSIIDDLQIDKQFTTRSIFEGASKYDILSYLVDAKERGIVPEESYTYNFNNSGEVIVEEEEESKTNRVFSSRVSHMSTVSDSSEDSSLVTVEKNGPQKNAEVERNDSGVGSETSKCSRSRYLTQPEMSMACEDCDLPVDPTPEDGPLICKKCSKKRSERKETITEIVETEEKYSRDLQIILEEFYQPMLVAGLLTPEQLSAIFLNVEELLENSQALAERLRDTLEIALEQGDEDLLTVNIGKIFLEAAPMLHAFESYCVRQGPASLLLAGLEKEKELLRIFLRVSQMENTVLRRMNLNSFLMVPVQRVTKYPLLLARVYKVTPLHHESRDLLREAQHKIELHLSHMNSETKDVPSKLWRRISNNSGRRSSSEMDLVNIKLRKIAVDVLEWNHDEARFALEGRLLFTQPTDNNWRKGRTIKLTHVNALLVTNGKPNSSSKGDRPTTTSTSTTTNGTTPNEDATALTFPRHTGVREAALLLVRDKGGRYSLLREPLYLDRCVIATDPAWQSYFEVQELLSKDTFIFKAEDAEMTRTWYRQLQYHAQGMGAWRKRRNALANIMINGMGSRS